MHFMIMTGYKTSNCLICMSIVTITEWNKDGVELTVQLNIIFGFLTFS